MTTFLSKVGGPLVILTVLLCGEAQAEDRHYVSPGLTADRLVVRDPQGRVEFYVERTITGHLVIKDTGGSVVGHVDENSYRGNSSSQSRRRGSTSKRLSLPSDW